MTWQENLIANLLTVTILLAIFVIVYCRVTGKTLTELIRDIREGFSPTEQLE